MKKQLSELNIIELFYDKNKSKIEICKELEISYYTLTSFCKKNNIILKNKYTSDLINQRFGKLTVLKFSRKNNRGNSLWLCQCDCGNTKEVNRTNLLRNSTKSCGCLFKESVFKGYQEIGKNYWSRVIKNSRQTNKEFTISIEYAWDLFINQNRKCFISGLNIYFSGHGVGHYIKGTIQTASLDRIDSSKGYIEGNVQWVHKDINRMKQEFSEEYFIQMCELVTNNKKEN